MYSAPTIFWKQKHIFISESQKNTCFIIFRNTRVNSTAKVATSTQKASDTGFITVPYYLWNLGIPSPQRHQQRRVLDSAPCAHNVPDVPTPVQALVLLQVYFVSALRWMRCSKGCMRTTVIGICVLLVALGNNRNKTESLISTSTQRTFANTVASLSLPLFIVRFLLPLVSLFPALPNPRGLLCRSGEHGRHV